MQKIIIYEDILIKLCIAEIHILFRKRGLSQKKFLNGFSHVVVVTQTFPRHGGMAEDHGAPEAGKLPRAWTGG